MGVGSRARRGNATKLNGLFMFYSYFSKHVNINLELLEVVRLFFLPRLFNQGKLFSCD